MRDVKQVVRALCNRTIKEKDTLTTLDQTVGDGDLGINLERGALAVLAVLDKTPIDESTASLLIRVASTLNAAGCGTFGTLISFGILAGAARSDELGAFLEAALAKVMQAGRAQLGEKTMVDALHPAVIAIGKGGTLNDAAEAARQGADETRQMTGRRGRSLYSGIRSNGIPDPGAYLIAVLVEEAAHCGGEQ